MLWKLIRKLKYIKMKKLNFMLSIVVIALTLNSCSNDDSSNNYPYNVSMTDASGPYDAVYVDLKAVEVIGDNGKTVSLNTTAGIYNLLDFTNGADTLIASSTLNNARVNQIRLILGPNNTVVINGVSYPLSTPSAEQSG